METYFAPFDRRQFVRTVMRKRGFTSVRALAIAAGVPQPTLQRYLSGETEEMETRNWMQIANALSVSIGELFGEVPLLSDDGNEIARHVRELKQLSEPQRQTILEATRALAEKTRK